MLTSSLQSTWDNHKTRQRSRYGSGAYHNAYNNDAEAEGEHKGRQSNLNSSKNSFGNRHQLNNTYHSSNNDLNGGSNYSELPNLKVPQHGGGGYGRHNLGSTAGGLGGSSHNISPRGGGVNGGAGGSMNSQKDMMNLNRKYRASSRQSGHKNRRNNHLRYGDNYGGGNGMSSAHASDTSHLKTAGGMATGQQQHDSNSMHLLPQINAPSQHNAGKRSMYLSNGSKPPSPTLNLMSSQSPQSSGLAPSNTAPSNTGSAPVAREFTNGNMLLNTEDHYTSGVTSIRGLKPGNPNWINQDNFFVSESFAGNDVRVFCVLDGHGEHGHLVSRRCREQFPHFIKNTSMDMDSAFSMMQNDLSNSNDFDARCSGATCVMAVVYANKVSVYNCGDSRAVLGRRNPNGSVHAVALSKDHKPDKPEERKRILGVGGHLGCRQVLVNQPGRGPVSMPVGPCRVWYQHRGETLGLAMSRSLGDTIVHKSGVSAEPEMLERGVDDYDDFLILATDGVWDVVDNNHAVQMVHNYASKSVNWSTLEAANTVCRFARSRWEKLSPMIDDITCIVVKLHR